MFNVNFFTKHHKRPDKKIIGLTFWPKLQSAFCPIQIWGYLKINHKKILFLVSSVFSWIGRSPGHRRPFSWYDGGRLFWWSPQAVDHCGSPRSDANQARSLTQFYSVDFSQSRIDVKKCVFNKRTIKVCVSCCWPLRPARHTWLCPCISVVPEATHEASQGPKKGAVAAQKALQGSETRRRGSCWEERKRRVFPWWGVI